MFSLKNRSMIPRMSILCQKKSALSPKLPMPSNAYRWLRTSFRHELFFRFSATAREGPTHVLITVLV